MSVNYNLKTQIKINLGKHTYKFDIDLMKYNNLLKILDFIDEEGQEVYLHNISQKTMQTVLRTLELLHKQNIQVYFPSRYDLELKDMKIELHFSKYYEIEDTVYYRAIAFLENTIYVLVKANLIKINISELKEDIDFMQLVEDKYYKRG